MPLVHLEPVASTYEGVDEVRAMNAQHGRHGLSSILEIQQAIRSKRFA